MAETMIQPERDALALSRLVRSLTDQPGVLPAPRGDGSRSAGSRRPRRGEGYRARRLRPGRPEAPSPSPPKAGGRRPAELQAAVEQAYRDAQVRFVRLERELAAVVTTFADANLPLVVLKGYALARTYYA